MTETQHESKPRNHQDILILLLIIVVVIVLISLVHTFYISLRGSGLQMSGHHDRRLNQLTVGQIQPWMTFAYLNRVFHLPADYLKTNLQITDDDYPNIAISSFAASQNLTPSSALLKVQNLIGSYQQ